MRRDRRRDPTLDPENWTWGLIYRCRDDRRIIVRRPFFVGWTWNFGHPLVLPAILGSIAAVLLPPAIGLLAGVTSPIALLSLAAIPVLALVPVAQRSATSDWRR